MKQIKYVLLCLLLAFSLLSVTACSGGTEDKESSSKKDRDDDEDDDDKDKDKEKDEDGDFDEDDLEDLAELADLMNGSDDNTGIMSGVADALGADDLTKLENFSNEAMETMEIFYEVVSEQYPDDYFSFTSPQITFNLIGVSASETTFNYYMDSMSNGDQWTDVKYEWPNGAGSTVSSFSPTDNGFTYVRDDSYVDNESTSSSIVTYDGGKDFYHKKSTYDDVNDYQDRITYLEYISDGSGGYFVQRLDLNLNEGFRDVLVGHFNDDTFEFYTYKSDGADENETLIYSFEKGIPNSLDELIDTDYNYYIYDGESLEYEVIQ